MVGEEIVTGLYLPSDVISYIHVLVYYVSDMMRNHKNWGLKAFSCAAVEKKNHQHVSYFFCKTLKNGGQCANGYLSIKQLLYHENKTLYYTYNNHDELLAHPFFKPQKIYIQ